jgi:hypothetical protein
MAVQDGCAMRSEAFNPGVGKVAPRRATPDLTAVRRMARKATLESCPELRWNEAMPPRHFLIYRLNPRFMGA